MFRSCPKVGLLEAPQILQPKWGLKRDVEKGIEAEQEGDDHQEDKLNDFRADEGEVQ